MIVERHYDDETLVGLLGASSDTLTDPHLAVCSSCSDTLASYRAIADVLGEEAAWDLRDLRQEPVPETMASLRAVSAAMASDAAAAESAVGTLLGRPQSEWIETATADRQHHSPAVIRALVEASAEALGTSPARALEIARVAVRIAQSIAAGEPVSLVAPACGSAWRQYAYAAFYVGDYERTAEGIEQAQRAFEQVPVADYELARVDIVLSLLCNVKERLSEAIEVAERAARVFEAFGDRQRYASARMAAATALMSQNRYREALPILEKLESDYCRDIDSDTRSRVIGNVALCQMELNQVSEALANYQVAATIDEELGNVSEAARGRYHVASLLATKGHHAEAKNRLRAVRRDFQRLGMLHLAVSAGLDLAEILLAENAYAEAEQLCAEAVQQFQKTGLATTTQGLTALTYLREAAGRRKATPQTARDVRKYIERLTAEPELLFVPPPLRFL